MKGEGNMKYLKKRSLGNVTIRTVTNNEKTKVLCIVGLVGDLTKKGILEPNGLDERLWLSISNTKGIDDQFGKTLGEALRPYIKAGF